jgi:hypothetical protein
MIYATQPSFTDNAKLTEAMLYYLGERQQLNKLHEKGIDIKAAKQLRLIHQDFVELIAIVCEERAKERAEEVANKMNQERSH